MSSSKKKSWWTPVAHFVGHSVAGSAIFSVIALTAAGLGALVKWIAGLGLVDVFVVDVLSWLEHVLVVGDVVLLLLFLAVALIKAIKEVFAK